LHMVGEAKMAVFKEAMKPGPAQALPIRLALHGSSACEVFYAP
jgi:6-phosphogluconolactonase/glucosamine-6-phosphate isomerase/deaminase